MNKLNPVSPFSFDKLTRSLNLCISLTNEDEINHAECHLHSSDGNIHKFFGVFREKL